MKPQANLDSPANFTKTAVLISPLEQDHDILKTLFRAQHWTLHSAHSLGAASKMLRDTMVPVVITERDLPVGTWKEVLEVTHHLRNPPLVIVASLHADDHLWAEALNLGAHDVVAKPFCKTELVRVLSFAWIRREEQLAPTLSAYAMCTDRGSFCGKEKHSHTEEPNYGNR